MHVTADMIVATDTTHDVLMYHCMKYSSFVKRRLNRPTAPANTNTVCDCGRYTCNLYNSTPEKNTSPQLFPGSILLPPVNGVDAPVAECQRNGHSASIFLFLPVVVVVGGGGGGNLGPISLRLKTQMLR